jgi:hypothetical protein
MFPGFNIRIYASCLSSHIPQYLTDFRMEEQLKKYLAKLKIQITHLERQLRREKFKNRELENQIARIKNERK